jgi:hypothetical protein
VSVSYYIRIGRLFAGFFHFQEGAERDRASLKDDYFLGREGVYDFFNTKKV